MGRLLEFPDTAHRPTKRPLWRHVVGEVLRGERLEQERILTEVAATAGVSPQYLSEVERGRKEPSSEVLGAVAEALGLGLAEVAGRVAQRLAPREPVREPSVIDVATSSPPAPRDAPSPAPSAGVYLLAA